MGRVYINASTFYRVTALSEAAVFSERAIRSRLGEGGPALLFDEKSPDRVADDLLNETVGWQQLLFSVCDHGNEQEARRKQAKVKPDSGFREGGQPARDRHPL